MNTQFQISKIQPKIIEFPSGRMLTENDLPKPQTTLPFSPEIKQQLDEVATKGFSLDKIHNAIDLHPDIQDKKGAKDYIVSALQKIIPSRTIEIQNKEQGNKRIAELTAYNPVKSQTDKRPFEMASGKKVYEGAIATNDESIPFGTKVYIPSLNRNFTVDDLLGPGSRKRFKDSGKLEMDILMNDEKQALEFGRQKNQEVIFNAKT